MKRVTPPYFLKMFTSGYFLWEKRTNDKTIYLTFDDGPTPGVTDKILEILYSYRIKATFFCVGEMVKNNPGLYLSLISAGHKTGNHTYSHLHGWKTSTKDYISNISKASEQISSNLFRPPYGKMTPLQISSIRKEYDIIMWSVLTNDFDQKIKKKTCLQNALHYTKPGSIVVFHDSKKAAEKCFYALPRFIEHFLKTDYMFKTL